MTPILASKTGFVAYRVLLVPCALAAMLFMVGVWRTATAFCPRRSARLAASASIAGLAVVMAQLTVVNIAFNANTELSFFRAKLARLADNGPAPTRIYVRTPPEGAVFVRYPLYLDLAYVASNHEGLMAAIVHCVAEELGVGRERYVIEPRRAHEVLPQLQPGDIAIDVNDLLRGLAQPPGSPGWANPPFRP